MRRLPKLLRDRLVNVEIVIEDEPVRDGNLLGLYEGVPLKDRSVWYGNILPDKITIFKRNIERLAGGEPDLEKTVDEVLMHEIGHYFGFDEAALKDLTAPDGGE